MRMANYDHYVCTVELWHSRSSLNQLLLEVNCAGTASDRRLCLTVYKEEPPDPLTPRPPHRLFLQHKGKMILANIENRTRAVEKLRAAAEKSQRSHVPFPHAFVDRWIDERPPALAHMIQGGRGGKVRLRLYLCMTMMATRQPFDIRTPPTPAGWTTMLGLSEQHGPRRIGESLRWLRNNHYIQLTHRAAAPASIGLLHASGDGSDYRRPALESRYIRLPITLWNQGWILDLSAVELAILMVLLDSQGGQARPYFVTKQRRETYGLSHDTWTKGANGLKDHGLLTIDRSPLGTDTEYHRLRNAYWLDLDKLSVPPRRQ